MIDPITLLVGGGMLLLATRKPNSNASEPGNDAVKPLQPVSAVPTVVFDLPDVAPEFQGGNFKRDYDEAFLEVCEATSVPFALLKAHAIRESSLKHTAFRQEPNGKASYGLMQVLWWQNSSRFQAWGYSDDQIGDGSLLYDPVINSFLAAQIILDNFQTWGNLRDAVNAYNTGRSEKLRPAPYNYVDDVLSYYSTLVGRKIT